VLRGGRFNPTWFNDGWNLTANMFEEINTRNTVTGYTSGDVLHAEFTAVKTIGKWTIGPVAYYIGQVTDDQSSEFYGGAINVNRYNIWAAGGLVGYNFGPVQLNVWAFDQISANASGGTAGGPGVDSAIITKGWSAFASLSFRCWAPDGPRHPRVRNLTSKSVPSGVLAGAALSLSTLVVQIFPRGSRDPSEAPAIRFRSDGMAATTVGDRDAALTCESRLGALRGVSFLTWLT
jgi:hypothetical protein